MTGSTPNTNKYRQVKGKGLNDEHNASSNSLMSMLPIDENNNLSNQTLENVLPQTNSGSTNDPHPF